MHPGVHEFGKRFECPMRTLNDHDFFAMSKVSMHRVPVFHDQKKGGIYRTVDTREYSTRKYLLYKFYFALFFKQACTNAVNSGCGLSGRAFNSG